MKKKNLLFVLDNDYLYPFLMVLGSLSRVTDNEVRIFLINIEKWEDGEQLINQENLMIAKNLSELIDLELNIVNLDLGEDFNLSQLTTYGHISKTAWVKVFALFSKTGYDFNEFVYVDPDTLPLPGFLEIFSTQASSKSGFQARPTSGHSSFENRWEHQRQSSLKASEEWVNSEWYFNSGVMKIDLSKWSNYKFWIDWHLVIDNLDEYKIQIVDQDLLNLLILGDYTPLPISFNTYPAEYQKGVSKLIHYAGGLKPWYFRSPLSRIRLNDSTKHAMKEWHLNEALTLDTVQKSGNTNLYLRIKKLKKKSDRGVLFALSQLFPKIAQARLVQSIFLKYLRR